MPWIKPFYYAKPHQKCRNYYSYSCHWQGFPSFFSKCTEQKKTEKAVVIIPAEHSLT